MALALLAMVRAVGHGHFGHIDFGHIDFGGQRRARRREEQADSLQGEDERHQPDEP
jgi:hypothetical protein